MSFLRAMSFRRRVVLLSASAVALAIVLASAIVYFVTRGELHGQIDQSLRERLTPGLPQSIQIKQSRLSPRAAAQVEKAAATLRRAPQQRLGAEAFMNALEGAAADAEGKEEGRVGAHAEPRAEVRAEGYGQAAVASGSIAVKAPSSGPLGQLGILTQTRHLHVTRRSTKSIGELGAPGTFSEVRSHPDGTETAVSISLPSQGFGGVVGYAQLVQAGGIVLSSNGRETALPVTSAAHAVAAGRRPAFFSEKQIEGTPMRVLTERAPPGGVWQVALPLTEVNSTLKKLLIVLGIVSLGGILIAAALGLLVSRAALTPMRRLMAATEQITKTQDLAHRIPAATDDELGRLARSFNTMLAALERSRLSQRQLVSDASHELRTPLTSIQANLDALALGDVLSRAERERATDAAKAQLRELTALIGDLVDLSKTEVEQLEVEDVRLDLLTAAAVKRARLHAPDCAIVLDATPCLVRGAPPQLDRALSNLLDNACKWSPPSPPGKPVEVSVKDGRLEVRDHGEGIDDEDLPRVFDRFYRSAAARGRPGSGLGLAIVRQVAETHGGTVHAVNDPNGGARLVLELPSLPMSAAERDGEDGA
ncbi:MAG TPA: HAMP domain-containing sensor histidine kinase [Solirubrobacteraceae bacterium]